MHLLVKEKLRENKECYDYHDIMVTSATVQLTSLTLEFNKNSQTAL